jgi:hypothetical protein
MVFALSSPDAEGDREEYLRNRRRFRFVVEVLPSRDTPALFVQDQGRSLPVQVTTVRSV